MSRRGSGLGWRDGIVLDRPATVRVVLGHSAAIHMSEKSPTVRMTGRFKLPQAALRAAATAYFNAYGPEICLPGLDGPGSPEGKWFV